MKSSEPPTNAPAPADPPVESPCRRQCCLDEVDRCIGCGRLLTEILEWGNASNNRRREICAQAKTRLPPSPLGNR